MWHTWVRERKGLTAQQALGCGYLVKVCSTCWPNETSCVIKLRHGKLSMSSAYISAWRAMSASPVPTLTHQPPVRIPGLFARIPPWNHEFFTSNKHPTICLGIAVAELWSYRANKASVVPGVTKSFDELVPSLHRKITAMALSAKKGDVICKPPQKAKQHSNI